MRQYPIRVPRNLSDASVLRAIEGALAKSGLKIAGRGTLKKFDGCAHWHLKNGDERGTLELTWWPARRKLWFKVQNSRSAGWIGAQIELLSQTMRDKLGRRP